MSSSLTASAGDSLRIDIHDFLKPLRIDNETLYRLAHRLSLTYRQLAANSFDQFFTTAVTRLPTGHETGHYLAVYVGQYYVHVAFIDLLGRQGTRYRLQERQPVRRILEKAWPLSEQLRRDCAPALFSWIGDCIAEVVADSLSPSLGSDIPEEITMGISFCLPIMQKSLDEAILMPTGKGFSLGSDLNLRQALLDGYECHTRRDDDDLGLGSAKRRRHCALPKLKIAAMTNDTVATLASLAYSISTLPNSRVVMSLLVGAGCNSTVSMKLSDLHEAKIRHIRTKHPDACKTLVCTEWTLHGTTPPLRELGIVTEWDSFLDMHSKRPGFQTFEYMIGGRYVGELVRIICYDYFHNILGISRSELPVKLVEEYGLSTDFLSLTVAPSRSDESLSYYLSQELLPPESSSWQWTSSTAGYLRIIAATVQSRGAALVAASTVGLLACADEIQLQDPDAAGSGIPGQKVDQEDKPDVAIFHMPDWQNGPEELVVAFSGGVIQYYPKYKETVQRHIDHLLIRSGPQDGGRSIFLREASGGGIIGVGVLAGTVAGKIEGIVVSSLEKEGSIGSALVTGLHS